MNKRIVLFGLTTTLLFSMGCGSSTSKTDDDAAAKQEPEALLQAGQEKFNAYCYSCHNPQSKPESRLAPPPIAMQERYKKAHADEESFTHAITDFVLHPSMDKALMKEAVEKFGLMPVMSYPKEELDQIAYYIYHGNFSAPGPEASVQGPVQQGQELAMSTKRILGKNLMAALNEGGAVHAVDFCNTKAIHFTDSMSTAFNARIQRVSDRPRNPNNRANNVELAAIAQFKEQLKEGGQAKPVVSQEGDGYRFYGPITTNAMCLQCHGNIDNDISPETTQKIKERYPKDEATGYGLNEVRGIWSIYFEPT
jgi:cytochrome c2